MNKSGFEAWLKKHGKAWSERNPQAAASLFSKDCKYYESALGEPCENWDAILKLWSVVPENQRDVTFDFKIIAIEENAGIVNWRVERTLLPSNEKQLIDGIYEISLNGQGLCTYFKQWRTVRQA